MDKLDREHCGCYNGKCGCVPSDYEDVCTIGIEALKKIRAAQEDFIFVNILSKDKFDDCRIPGSLNMPLDQLEEKIKEFKKDQPLIVYGADYGHEDATNACLKLKKLGYKSVHLFEGGIREWKENSQPCEGPCIKL